MGEKFDQSLFIFYSASCLYKLPLGTNVTNVKMETKSFLKMKKKNNNYRKI